MCPALEMAVNGQPLNAESEYPRVLVCVLTRVNAHDAFNNNLLLRNLFADWPKDRIAQIHSGGSSLTRESNDDEGFFGSEYRVGDEDRRFGPLKTRLRKAFKKNPKATETTEHSQVASGRRSGRAAGLIRRLGRFVTESGLAETIFPVRPSEALLEWVRNFNPDVIFAQGYNLSFTWLPMQLKKRLGVPIAFYTSDDWPSYIYTDRAGLMRVISPFIRRIVAKATQELITDTDCPLAFNRMMALEYQRRYGKAFGTIMHSDDPDRFRRAEPIGLQPPGTKSIVAAGGFNSSRWPLLLDMEEACRELAVEGLEVRVTVLTSSIAPEGRKRVNECRHIEVRDDPGHDLLPSYLKGADALFLPETFDERQAEAIRYSVSTKAHLFMLAQRPILVYGDARTGLVTYARDEGWANVVCTRDIPALKSAVRRMLTDQEHTARLVAIADEVFQRNHDSRTVRKEFLNIMRSCRNGTLDRDSAAELTVP